MYKVVFGKDCKSDLKRYSVEMQIEIIRNLQLLAFHPESYPIGLGEGIVDDEFENLYRFYIRKLGIEIVYSIGDDCIVIIGVFDEIIENNGNKIINKMTFITC